jgi:hypothetical protein
MYIGSRGQPLEGVVSVSNPNVCTLIGYCIGHGGRCSDQWATSHKRWKNQTKVSLVQCIG